MDHKANFTHQNTITNIANDQIIIKKKFVVYCIMGAISSTEISQFLNLPDQTHQTIQVHQSAQLSQSANILEFKK